MIKKIVFGVLVVTIGLLTTLTLSPSSTRWIANQYLAADDYTIECLDYTLQSFTRIDISAICVVSSEYSISAKSANIDLSQDTLSIEHLSVNLHPTDSPSSAKPVSLPILTIPNYVPKIEIDIVEISAKQLKQPIIFSLTQPARNSFSVGKDWNALVTLEENGLGIELDWTLASLRPYLPQNILAIIGQHQWDSPIRSNAELRENSITSNHLFTLDFMQPIEGCNLDLTMGGSAQVDADLTSQQTTLDLSQLAILVNLQNCQPLQNIPPNLHPGTITVGFPEKIVANQYKVSTPQIDINLVEPLATEFTFSEVSFLTSGTFTSLLKGSVDDGKSVNFNTLGKISINNGNPMLALPHSELRITDINYNNINLSNITTNFSVVYDQQLELKGKASIQDVIAESGNLNELESTFSVQGSDINNLDILLNTQFKKGQFAEFSLAKTQQNIKLKLVDLNRLTGNGKSQIKVIKAPTVSLTDLSIDHSLNANIAENLLSSNHTLTLNKELSIVAEQSQENVDLSIAPQSVTLINPIVQQLVPDMSFYAGEMSAQMDFNLLQNTGTGRVSLDQLSLLRSDMIITEIAMDSPFTIDSAGLQLASSKLTINEVYNGASVTGISADIAATDSLFSATKITAGLFDGQLSVDHIWLDTRDQTIEVLVQDINLQKILNLQEKAGVNAGGIEISGLISGRLPLTIKNLQPSISNAMLSNTGLGTLKVNGNEAFQALKQQSPEIGENLALLENFKFDSLESSLNMTTTGQTYLDIALKGKNPDKNQALNFNYTHDQDMFTLFKALRIADDFKEKIEKRLSKVH